MLELAFDCPWVCDERNLVGCVDCACSLSEAAPGSNNLLCVLV